MKLCSVGKSPRSLLTYPMHHHARWELICNFRGHGTMTVGEMEYPFCEGTLLLCPPNTPHEKSAEHGFEDLYVQFSGCDFEQRVYVLEADPEGYVFHLMRLLHSIWFDSIDRAVCNSLFDALMALLRPALIQHQNKYVQQLRRRIAEEFTDPDLHLHTLMAESPLSPDHLRRLFKQEVGQTPQDYLSQLRLEHAQHLLRTENTTVSEAAFRSGFNDPLYFSRIFRKRIGAAPTQWKR